jgi:hypothetical protein
MKHQVLILRAPFSFPYNAVEINNMIFKIIILGLTLFPMCVLAQVPDKCGSAVALPKELYDSFQLVRNSLSNADAEAMKFKDSRNELLKKYLGCENQADVANMLKQADDLLRTAENNQKTWAEPFARIEGKIRRFVTDHPGKSVEYRYYDQYGGGKLGTVVTTIFTVENGRVEFNVSSYQLTSPMLN